VYLWNARPPSPVMIKDPLTLMDSSLHLTSTFSDVFASTQTDTLQFCSITRHSFYHVLLVKITIVFGFGRKYPLDYHVLVIIKSCVFHIHRCPLTKSSRCFGSLTDKLKSSSNPQTFRCWFENHWSKTLP